MQRAYLALLFVAACSFDRSGVGAHVGDDGGHGAIDAAQASADAPQGTPDAHVTSSPDARVDAGPPDAQIGVGCGNQTCAPGQVCCGGGFGGGNTFDCADKCDGNQNTYACDGPEDCPGQECCFGQGGSSCAASCGWGEQTACRSDADCGGGSCCPTQYPNLMLCGTICF